MSTAQRAIFRLIAGSAALPFFEKIQGDLGSARGRPRIDAATAEEIGRQAIADPDPMERAQARFLGQLAQAQENVEAIVAIAQAKLDASGTGAGPDDDWMNVFARTAELASSARLRERLAEVLVVEIRRPGTFARGTVRLLAEIDDLILEAFQAILTHRVGDCIVCEPDWSQGPGFATGVMLEDAGLISGSAGFTRHTMILNDERNAFFIGRESGIVLQGTPGVSKHIPIWLLTRTGREVAALLPPPDERPALRRAAQLVDKADLDQIMLGRALPAGEGQITIEFDECAWEATTG